MCSERRQSPRAREVQWRMESEVQTAKHRKTVDKSSLTINAVSPRVTLSPVSRAQTRTLQQDAMKVDEEGKPKAMTNDATQKAPPQHTASKEKPGKPPIQGEKSSHGTIKKEASRKVEKPKHAAKPTSQKTENKTKTSPMTVRFPLTAPFSRIINRQLLRDSPR